MMDIINPATDAIITSLQPDSRQTLQAKFAACQQAQTLWRTKGIEERLQVIRKFNGALENKIEHLALVLTEEMGKPLQESRNEIKGACYRIDYFLQETAAVLAAQSREVGQVKEVLTYAPLGVVGNISAWNYPFLVGVNCFIPALLGGNGVVYKPSEYATRTGLEIQNLLVNSGLPANLFTVAIGTGAVGKEVTELPLNALNFTGSLATGRQIHQKLAERLIPVGLELGGKDPLYICDDVDIAVAAAGAAEGAFYNNGQSCCAVERIYVDEKIHDAFVEAFVAKVKELKVGDPQDPSTTQGPLARKNQRTFLQSQIDDAVAKGATLAIGGRSLPGVGAFFQPTVLLGVNHNMAVMREESFGPVIGIMKVQSDAEAVKLMDDTEFGLTAGVYTKDLKRGQELLSQLEVGNSYVNCCDRVSPFLPWAGQRSSGLGATLGQAGILAFVRSQGFHLRS